MLLFVQTKQTFTDCFPFHSFPFLPSFFFLVAVFLVLVLFVCFCIMVGWKVQYCSCHWNFACDGVFVAQATGGIESSKIDIFHFPSKFCFLKGLTLSQTIPDSLCATDLAASASVCTTIMTKHWKDRRTDNAGE